MTTKLSFPAISSELKFIAHHYDEVEDVLAGDVKADTSLLALLSAVGDRAEQDLEGLFKDVQVAVDAGIGGLLRVKWGRISLDEWAVNGLIYMARGPKRRICLAGLYLSGGNEPGVVGWMYPPGGLDGRREIVRVCKNKVPGLHIASDSRKRYEWATNDDAVIWLHEKTANKSRDQLLSQIRSRTKLFFKAAKPTMKALADRT